MSTEIEEFCYLEKGSLTQNDNIISIKDWKKALKTIYNLIINSKVLGSIYYFPFICLNNSI